MCRKLSKFNVMMDLREVWGVGVLAVTAPWLCSLGDLVLEILNIRVFL